MTSSLQRFNRPPVSLRVGNDEQVAEQLRRFIRDAEDGVRRIAIAGAYCEWIVQNLPHGKLTEWLATHCPDVQDRTVRGWRAFARAVLEASKFTAQQIDLPAHELLLADPAALTEETRAIRKTIDDLLAGKTYRQLAFEFKQMEQGDDGEWRVKAGRLKGCSQTRTPVDPEDAMEDKRRRGEETLRMAIGLMEQLQTDPGIRLLSNASLLERYMLASEENVKLARLLYKGLR
jgi:hypothetical protein